jgi:hypothetical protein
MRPLLAASPALLLATTLLAAPASAQTMLMPYENNPIATPPGVPPPTEGLPAPAEQRPSYGAFGTGPQPLATGAYPVTSPPAANQGYAAPTYNSYGPYTGTYGAYGATPPAQDQYSSPSASRTARPYGY